MEVYRKSYVREVCLIALEVWEEHQQNLIRKVFGEVPPLSIFDVYGGVADVCYEEDSQDAWSNIIANKANKDSSFVPEQMKLLGENVDKLEKIWHQKKLSSREEIIDLFSLAAWTWVGVSISYFLPDIKDASKTDQDLGMALRNRTLDFLEFTDHVLQDSLKDLYPNLGDLVKYISIEELKKNEIPDEEVLKEREKHYIYYNFKIYTKITFEEFIKSAGNLEVKEDEVPEGLKEITGQTAMGGKVTGPVRILHKKAEIPDLQDGEVLVASMTTPDYLPAMNKAIAFITNEGGVTCHAAIVAREIGKPCIIGTKIATKALKTGDMVEVDADNGIVRIL